VREGELPRVSELYLDPIDLERWRAGALVPDAGFLVRSLARSVRALVSNLPMFVGQTGPAWPEETEGVVRRTFDALAASPEPNRREAAAAIQALAEEFVCPHGLGPLDVATIDAGMLKVMR
jgi:hypothetical protein